MSNETSRSWFAVFNNPAEHGYSGTPEEVCNQLKSEWIAENETRSGAWAYCISKDGLHHVHMVLCDANPMRFSLIKKSYCIGMHFEATKGTKKQSDDYINKRGAFEEKGETIEYITYHGEIRGRQGHRSDLEEYYERLLSGETPKDIMRSNPKSYCHINVLKNMFFDIRSQNTPIIRDLKVYWHVGKPGSGKSYYRLPLAEEVGEDNIYYMTSFNSGGLDRYNGEPYLWIEDFRGNDLKLQELLRMLDKYKAEIPARYSNIKALWKEVHITSVLTPRECYPKVDLEDNDRIEQLLRRITSLVYHAQSAKGEYYHLYFDPFSRRSDMEKEMQKCIEFNEEWVTLLSDKDY